VFERIAAVALRVQDRLLGEGPVARVPPGSPIFLRSDLPTPSPPTSGPGAAP